MSDNTPQGDNPDTPYSPPPATPSAQPQQPQQPSYNAPPAYGAPQAPGAYPGYAPAPGQAYAPAAPTNPLAITALIAGIAGLTIVPFIGSIVAIITGHMALSKIKTSGEQGRGMALGGLITGYVGVVLGIIMIIVVFGMIAALSTYSAY